MAAKILKGAEFEGKLRLKKEIKTSGSHHTVDAPQEAGGVINRRTLEARDRAEQIIVEAESDAKGIRAQAQKILNEIEDSRDKACREGFIEGETKGISQVTEELVRLEAMREKFYNDAEKEIIGLVIAAAEKVIGKLVEDHPEVIRTVVRQALERSLGDRITVRINPDDLKTIQSGNFEFKDVLDRTKRLHFKEDETITKGGCIVETEVGTIDARIETQMEAIRKALEI